LFVPQNGESRTKLDQVPQQGLDRGSVFLIGAAGNDFQCVVGQGGAAAPWQWIDRDGPDPLKTDEVKGWLAGELGQTESPETEKGRPRLPGI
jgi:hypothetical protein